MGVVKNRKNKVPMEPKAEASKQESVQSGYAKIRGLTNVSISKPDPKQVAANQSTMGASAPAKPETTASLTPTNMPSIARTVPRSSIQTPTHPLKAKASPTPANTTRPRPGPKSRTKLTNKTVTMPVPVIPAVKEEAANYLDTKDLIQLNASSKDDSEEIMIVEEESVSEYSEVDNEALSEIMKQVEDLENSFKSDLERKNKELENERKTVHQLRVKNEDLDLALAEVNEDVATIKAELTKENEDKSKQIEAFKSSNEGMMEKIKKLNDDNHDVNEKYKNLLLEMEELKERKDAEIKKEKDSLKAVLLKNVSNENTLKQTIKMFEKIVKEKGDDLQKEYEIVDQLKKKNEVLENLEKKGKLLLKKKEIENESLKTQSKKNTDIFAKKLKQKQEELEKEASTSSEIINKKDEELNEVNKMLEKVSKDLEKMEEWKVTEVEREKKSLISMIQKNLEESAAFKNKIENLEESVKNKDEIILKKDKKIESLDKKIVEKDKLFKDLKVKVSKLITEFTKGLKEKGEQLLSKNQENVTAHSKIKLLENKLFKSEVEKKESMRTVRQFKSIIVDLSSKITKLKCEQKNEAIATALTEKRLQNNIIKLMKRSKKNSEKVVKLQNELSKNRNADSTNNNIDDNVEKIPMLTYLWPIVTNESGKPKNVVMSLPLLKCLDPVITIHIFIPPKPVLMLTYHWPVVQVTDATKATKKLAKTNKRKLLDPSPSSAAKRICLSYTGPQIPLFKRIDSILEPEIIPDPVSSQLEMPSSENPSQILKLTYLWPIAKCEPVKNLIPNEVVDLENTIHETSLQSLNKKSVESSKAVKRKCEETGKNISKTKKIKLSQEAIEEEKQQIKIFQEKLIRIMTINLCNDEKVRRHVKSQFSSIPSKSTIPVSVAVSKTTPTLKSEISPASQQRVQFPQKPMLTYLWPLVQYNPTGIKFIPSLNQQSLDMIPALPLIQSLEQEMKITVVYPSKPLQMITYNWPIVLANRTKVLSVETESQTLAGAMPNFMLMKSLTQEMTITISYPSPPLLMITYLWPVVLSKPLLKLCTENEIIGSASPQFPLLRTLHQETTIIANFPLKPVLMITYLKPTNSKKRKFINQILPSPKRICTSQNGYSPKARFPLVNTVDMILEIEIDEPTSAFLTKKMPSLMLTYLWPICKYQGNIGQTSEVEEIAVVMPEFPLMKSLNQEITITISYPSPPLLMITYLWPMVVTKPALKLCTEKEIISSVNPQFPLLRSLRPEIFVNCPLKPVLMITYLWPVVLVRGTAIDSIEKPTNSKKRKFFEQILPSPKRICTAQNGCSLKTRFPLVNTVDMIQEICIDEPSSALITKKIPSLMLTYLWPICRYQANNGQASSEVKRTVPKEDNAIDILANGLQTGDMVKSLIYKCLDATLVARELVGDLLEGSSMSCEEDSFQPETNKTAMISYLWPLVPYTNRKASLKRKSSSLTEENISKRMRLSEAMESNREAGRSRSNLLNTIPHFMPKVEILCELFPTRGQNKKPVKMLGNNQKVIGMIGYNWPLVPYSDRRNSLKRKQTFLNEEKSSKRLRLSKVMDSNRVAGNSEINLLSSIPHFMPKVEIISDLFPTQIKRTMLKADHKEDANKIGNNEKDTGKKIIGMIGYNWPVVVFKKPFNLELSFVECNPVGRIPESLSCSLITLKPASTISAPLMISYNWPISVYEAKDCTELAEPQVKIAKRKRDEVDEEEQPEETEEIQLVKKAKVDIKESSKRKLTDSEENENISKRIRKAAQCKEHHFQKILENLVKMMTVKLCNSPKILEKTNKILN